MSNDITADLSLASPEIHESHSEHLLRDAKGSYAHKRILFAVNVDWFFLSHRKVIAEAAKNRGFEVHVTCGDTGKGDRIRAAGLNYLPLNLSRKGKNPLKELRILFTLLNLYQAVKPDVVHHSTPKLVIYGSLVARLMPRLPVVNLISGFGYVMSDHRKQTVLQRFVRLLYRMALSRPNTMTVFQNPEDMNKFIQDGLVKADRAVLIRGSGVDCEAFCYSDEPDSHPVIMFSSRLLWDKGCGAFVEAARILKLTHPDARFVMVGAPDEGNPSAVPASELEAWEKEGTIEWWGHQSDMPAVLKQASIVVLPTQYSEGLPKALIEAAAVGRPIITTDRPGCREIVRHEVNGLLVPVGSNGTMVAALVESLQKLLNNPDLRKQYGKAGRSIAESEFREDIVVHKNFEIIDGLLNPPAKTKRKRVPPSKSAPESGSFPR